MFIEDKMKVYTTCGSIPYRTKKEVRKIINQIKSEFENKVKVKVLDGCVYYEHTFEQYN